MSKKSYSIRDIKKYHESISLYYFSQDTMEFFGQTLGDFMIRQVADRVFIFARRYVVSSDGQRTFMGWTFHEFITKGPKKYRLLPVRDENGDLVDHDTLEDIENFLTGLADK